MKALFGIALAAVLATPSYAAVHHKARINCGWPHPDAACHAPAPVPPVRPTPVTPAPTAATTCEPSDTTCVFKTITISGIQQDLVTALTQTATYAGTVNTGTGESWDTYLVECLNGTPAMGTAGQDGYVAAQPGLIAWLAGLQFPATSLMNVPALPDGAVPTTVAEQARLKVIASMSDVNNFVTNMAQNLSQLGFPKAVAGPCSGFIQNAAVTVPTQVVGEVAAVQALLVADFPKAFALKAAREHRAH